MKTIRTNISGLGGVRIEKWTVGIDIQKESIDKFADQSTGELYVGEFLEKGKPKQFLMPRDKWEDFKNI